MKLKRPPAALLSLALLAASAASGAQDNKAVAESLFQVGVALMQEGKFAEACPKLAESQRADPSSGTLLNLASCYEKIGKTASAWATFKEAAVTARAQGRIEREATANSRAAALEPSLSKLRIDAADLPGLVIKRNGLEVGRASLGTPIAVDPGEHTVVASAPGYKEWSTKVTVGANADSRTVTVPPLEQNKSSEGTLAPIPPEPPASGGGAGRAAGFIVGGVGVAGIAVGAIFGGLALGDKSDADASCPEKRCNKAGQDAIDAASKKALISTIGFGVGLAAVAGGVLLIVTSGPPRRAAEATPSAQILPVLGPYGGGAALLGRF